MNKPTKNLLFVIFLVFAFLGLHSPTKAETTTEFNPNFILSDEEIQDWQSMGRADIQAFLDNYTGVLKSLRAPDKDNQEKLISDIICQASIDYKINPKYLLVKLQKEQSLITDDTPTQRQLDFATGYACPDSAPCSDKYRGVGKQIDAAAGIMRWYYDNVNFQPWIKKANTEYNIDNTIVIPNTFATAFLYTYTPHLHGNQNFWLLWQKWFQQIYPDGTLFKTPSSSAVYVLQDGKKRQITSMSVLISRYNPNLIITVPDSELARYDSGKNVSLPNYSILKVNSNYYLLDDDTVRPFANYDTVIKMGYQPEEIIEVTESDISGYTVGTSISTGMLNPLGRLVKLKENGSLYFVKDNKYYPVPDENIAKVNYPTFSVETVAIKDLTNLERGDLVIFKDGTLIGIKGTNAVYVIEKGLKRHIANEDVFYGLGYDWKNILWINETTATNYKGGSPLYLRATIANTTSSTNTLTIDTAEDSDAPRFEVGKMVTTPADKTKIIGKEFSTNMDVYLVADYTTGKVLAGKNIDTVRPLASFTKVMTAYRLMKQNLSLTKAATYNEAKDKSVYHQFRITNGEKIRNGDLMKSMLVSSVNTAAKILANQVEKTEADFVKKMNQQAKDWALKNTVFTDSYGYDLGNIGTAREYLTIFRNTAKNTDILKIMALKDYEYNEVLDKDNKPHHFDSNSNKLVSKKGLSFTILASKTGYLDEAGSGLVMLVQRPKDKKKFVIITMGNPDYAKRFDDPQKLTEWALKNF